MPKRFILCVWSFVAAGLYLLCGSGAAQAEPYLAVQQGYRCAQCHMNPTGGGQRNVFGNVFAQTQLPARQLGSPEQPWNGMLNSFVALGGDGRFNGNIEDAPGAPATNRFEVEQMRLYLAATVIPNRLSLHVDEQLAPGSAVNREVYGLLQTEDHRWYLKAGQLYLPFGLRLEDQSAFVRQSSGINMTTPDKGLEVGWQSGAWEAQLAVSNGTAGSAELDTGKQTGLQLQHVMSNWRLGAAANVNDSDIGTRKMYAAFAGLRTGRISWLAEADLIDDGSFPNGGRDMLSGLLEANLLMQRGHNLKLSGEYFDPDRDIDEDEQTRWSLVYECTPIQFLQLRAGARLYDGIPQNASQNRRQFFIQLHAFF